MKTLRELTAEALGWVERDCWDKSPEFRLGPPDDTDFGDRMVLFSLPDPTDNDVVEALVRRAIETGEVGEYGCRLMEIVEASWKWLDSEYGGQAMTRITDASQDARLKAALCVLLGLTTEEVRGL